VKKQQKAEVVQQLRTDLATAEAVLVVEYKGITVGSLHQLRKLLREKGARFQVVKNTLLTIAVEGTANERLKDLAGGPIAVAYAAKDAPGLAKELLAYAKKEEKLVIRGGVLAGKVLDAKDVDALSCLPSIERMRAMLLGLLAAPAQRFLGLLLAPQASMLGVLQARAVAGQGQSAADGQA